MKAIVCKCINFYQFINNMSYPANFSEQTVHNFMCLAGGVHKNGPLGSYLKQN